MKTLIVLSLLFIAPAIHAEECSYQTKQGEKEKISIQLLGKGFEILKLSFLGPKADEYYFLRAHLKNGTTKEFVRFATRASQEEPLKLKVMKNSTFLYNMNKGGNLYEWKPEGGPSIQIECKQ